MLEYLFLTTIYTNARDDGEDLYFILPIKDRLIELQCELGMFDNSNVWIEA